MLPFGPQGAPREGPGRRAAHSRRRPAWLVTGGLIAALGLALVPCARLEGPESPAVLASWASLVVVVHLGTAALLAFRFAASGQVRELVLLVAYAMDAVLIAVHVATFPGVFSERGAFGASESTTAWLAAVWTMGWPILALVAAAGNGSTPVIERRLRRGAMVAGTVVAVAIGIVATQLALGSDAAAARLIDGRSYVRLIEVAGPFMLAANLAAAVVWVRVAAHSGEDDVAPWLAVALVASAIGVLLVLSSGTRYTVGWYAHRVASLAAAATVLAHQTFVSVRWYRRVVLQDRSLVDPLTGLASRDGLDAALRDARGPGWRVALLLIDIDDFREVNDTFGRDLGDSLLREAAARLRGIPHTALGRIAGDEFALLLEGGDDALVARVAEQIVGAFERPFLLGGYRVAVQVTVGVTVAERLRATLSSLLRESDVALHAAKSEHVRTAWYRSERDARDPRRLTLVADLRSALAEDALDVAFQPIVDLRSGDALRFEVLARWEHPTLGRVPPSEFIPISERSGLVGPLTRWALSRAVAEIVRERRRGHDISAAVNISPHDLADLGFADHVERILVAAGVPARSLALEITETAFLGDTRTSLASLRRLRALGVRIALDDFGTGYSALTYVRDLPVDAVKIDRSFVGDMVRRPQDRAIVGSIIELAHGLGLSAIAEGVEDEATERLLRELGCDLAQGFHISLPLSGAALDAWLDRRGADPLRGAVLEGAQRAQELLGERGDGAQEGVGGDPAGEERGEDERAGDARGGPRLGAP